MSTFGASGVTGNVFQREVLFEWKVPDYFSLKTDREYYYDSPLFSYSGHSWYLRLYPGGCSNSNRNVTYSHVSLFLRIEGTDADSNVSFAFGIRKSDGSVPVRQKEFRDISFSNSTPSFGEYEFWHREILRNEKSSLVPMNTLTLTCHMKQCSPQTVEAAEPPMKLRKLETLSTNMRDLFTSRTQYDVTIKVENREFRAHKAVLTARSPVFEAMFEHVLSETETGIVTIKDCDPDSFHDFLHYLYTGTIEHLSFRNMYHLYTTADKYDVKELKSFCVTYMMRNLMVKNVCDVITLADQFEDTELLSSAQSFFKQNVSKILSTAEWNALLKENHVLANQFFMEMVSTKETQT